MHVVLPHVPLRAVGIMACCRRLLCRNYSEGRSWHRPFSCRMVCPHMSISSWRNYCSTFHRRTFYISRFFHNQWPLLSPILSSCDFWLWNHLKSRGSVATLNDLKNSITLHVRSITTDQLRSAVEYSVCRLEILLVNKHSHMELFSLPRPRHD